MIHTLYLITLELFCAPLLYMNTKGMICIVSKTFQYGIIMEHFERFNANPLKCEVFSKQKNMYVQF